MGSYTHAEVVAAFAASAKSLEPVDPRVKADRVFIRGRSIFSYGEHHTIARIVRRGEAVVNTRKYSSSTSRHTGMVLHALQKAGVSVTTQDFSKVGDKVPRPPDIRALEL